MASSSAGPASFPSPVSDYIRCERSGALTNVTAGEQVRGLPRRRTCHIALPGNGFRLFDDRLLRWSHFAGDGSSRGPEHANRPVRREAGAQEKGEVSLPELPMRPWSRGSDGT